MFIQTVESESTAFSTERIRYSSTISIDLDRGIFSLGRIFMYDFNQDKEVNIDHSIRPRESLSDLRGSFFAYTDVLHKLEKVPVYTTHLCIRKSNIDSLVGTRLIVSTHQLSEDHRSSITIQSGTPKSFTHYLYYIIPVKGNAKECNAVRELYNSLEHKAQKIQEILNVDISKLCADEIYALSDQL